MRSSRPMPGNPWPHDMVLTLNNDDRGLLDLLWVREYWRLGSTGDVPPAAALLPRFERPVESSLRDKGEWESAWAELWAASLFGRSQPRVPAAGSWREWFGSAAFDTSYDTWIESVISDVLAKGRQQPDPERGALGALVPAWERGLATIVILPCAGEFTRRVDDSTLCVTRATRLEPLLYEKALQTF